MTPIGEREQFIAGEWLAGGGPGFTSKNPATGQTVWAGAAATASDVAAAIAAARGAQAAWADRPPEARIAFLQACAGELAANGDSLTDAIGLETGKPRWEVREELSSMVGKVAATIDVISGGRVDLGIGAGWYEHEYAGYGYEFLSPAGRIGQLREAIEIMKRLWTENEVHFEGRHYRLSGAICRPRPLQMPHIPIWVAGGGEQLTLRVAARHASHTNFGPNPEEFTRRSLVLANHCRDLGTDYDAIVRSTNMFVVCRETETEVAAVLAGIEDRYRRVVPEEQAGRAAGMYRDMAGTPEQLIERLRPWADAGLVYAIVYFPQAAYETTDIELFAREVIPAFR